MKRIISICVCIMLLASIVGCGSSETTTVGITKADTTSAAIQVVKNESSETSLESIEEVSNSSSESVSLGSGKYEDYWEGDSYFNIEGFAVDNGCDCVLWADDNGQTDKASANRVILFYGDWEIYVNDGHTLYAQNPVTKTERIMTPSYDSNLVSICRENNIKIGAEACQYVNDLLEEFKSN